MLEVKNLFKSYGKKQILKNVSFHLNKGESLGILGPNGAGKTTLLKVICGLIIPSSGTITFKHQPSIQMGAIFDDQRFLGHLSGLSNLKLFAHTLSNIKNVDWEEVFIKYGLHSSKHVKYKFYSSGMKKRLDLMSVFIEPKSLYVLDEPTNSLDIDSIIILYQTVSGLLKENKTFIVSSHHVAEMEKICHRFLIMDKGSIILEIKKEDVLKNYGSLENAYCSHISKNQK
jgi:ABC-2 type transport system ATP-binding protein